MPESDPCSVFRIAVALAALKHKPREQSVASYLLDLQSRFPIAARRDDRREWRTYALELEKQLATLKAQRDADQELLSKLRADAPQAASASDAPPPKKKSKKNPTKDQNDPECNWEQTRADWSRFLSSQYPPSPSLVAAYASLKGALVSPDADPSPYAPRLTDAILRALDAVHVFLFSAPNPGSDSQTQSTPPRLRPEHLDGTRIAMASPLLTYVLRTGLHALVCTIRDSTKSKRQRQPLNLTIPSSTDARAQVDKVLDQLLERVLLVLVRALAPLCSAHLSPLLSAPLKKDRASRPSVGKGKDKDKRPSSGTVDPLKTTDIRKDAFALIGTCLEALDALPPLDCVPSRGQGASGGRSGSIANGIKNRLGLETIRELEALYAVSPPCIPPTGPPPPSLSPQQPPPSTPASTPLSAPSQTQAQSQPQPQPRVRQRTQAAPELRFKQLEKLAGTRADRIRALATRDAGWFLASTLNLCVVAPPPVSSTASHGTKPENPGGTLLREALLDRIGKLVRSMPLGEGVGMSPDQQLSSDDTLGGRRNMTKAKFTIDPVCQNMLLAICERAMGQLASP